MIEHVIKRDGRVVPYSGECIKQAISKAALSQNVAFKDVELQQFLGEIESKFTETTVSVEDIQDAVEEYLMSIDQYRVARAYIVYREEHARMRALRRADDETRETRSQGPSRRSFSITNSEGKFEEFSVDTLRSFLLDLPESQAPEVDIEDIIDEVAKGAFEGMTTKDIARSLVLAARSRIERDPAYDALAAALQLAIVYKEALTSDFYTTTGGNYRISFRDCIQDGINAGRYTEKLLDFNIPKLTRALRPERDKLFKYLGVQTLYDRYLIHIEGRRIETPQFFWMRVAMGLAINEDNPTERAIEFYEVLSKLLFTSATPTLFNSGTNHPQLSSCYLTTVDDDLENIFDCIKDNAMLSKWAGGLGNDWTNVRATNAHIKGTNGTSQGVIPFLKVVNDTAIAVNQCFAGDTRVETPNGLVRIENIREGDLVLNGDGEYRKVREAHEYEQHGDMVQLRFLAGGAINVTTGHPLWVLANTKDAVPGWVEAGGVAVGDYVGRPGEDPYKDVAEGEWVTDQVLYRNGYVYYKVDIARHIAPTELVYDLVMDGPENYVTEYVLAHNGGKRKGAVCAYLEPWHLDFEEFLDLRKNTGDDRRRTHDMHTAAWIPDLFMQRVEANGQWTLFSPDEVPELHDLYGKAFKAKYEEYERMADEGKMRQFRRVNAVDLWRKHLTRLFETSHPWACFTGDTLVAVADGRGAVAISQLADSGVRFPVYSARPPKYSPKRKRLPNERAWVEEIKWATAFPNGHREVVKVHLDDGTTFRCTSDHQLALKDGGYCDAKDSEGKSLFPFNAWRGDKHPNNIYIGRNGDPRLRQARLIWEFHNGPVPVGYAVDHIINGGGDGISNLQILTVADHNRKTSRERMGKANPFYGKKHSDEARAKFSERSARMMTPEHKAHLSKKLSGVPKPDRYGLGGDDLIRLGRRFYQRYGSLSNRTWNKYWKEAGVPSAGYIANRFPSWSAFTSSCIENHKVVRVEYTGEVETVYDLSVEDNHNFFIVTEQDEGRLSGVLVHNCFKDPSNIRSPQDHVGVVHSSNLCCVDGDELVPVEGRGLVRARTLYEEGKEVRLLGKDAVHSCPMYMPVEMGKRVRIHTKEGYTHTVTPDHKVALVDGSQVMAKDLKEGDKLALQTLECEGSLPAPLYAFASGVHAWGGIDKDVVFGYRMPWHTRIPDEVLQGDYDTILAYCEGLRVGATVILGEQCPKNVTCCFRENIARDLQVLLLQIGIQTRLYVEKIGIYDTVWVLQADSRSDGSATFSHLEELPDAPAYCPTVPTEDHLWTCNGFLTRNTEILLNTSKDETAVCNLGSLNLGRFIEDGDINADRLGNTIVTAVRMLDNVIDINYYPTPEARNSNLKHRPIGLGLMGFQDALHKMGISYASDEGVKFAGEIMESISSTAIFASAALAMERGTYPSYKGSKWDRGLFPIDTVKMVEEERGEPVLMGEGLDKNEALWETVRGFVAEHGMRNSNVMAIAPTATISTIVGASQSIEPTYKFIYAKSNLSGDFTQVDEHLVTHLKEKGLWTPEILDELKYHDGCLADMPSIPQETKDLFKTAFEIDPEWLIKAASARQKWIDQGQSLNLYLREPSGKKIDEMYRFAWRAGLKTTYYLRTQAATTVEKSTVDINKHGIQPKWMKSKSASDGIQVDRGAPKQCSLDNPDCEACQ